MSNIHLVEVTPENVEEETLFCVKNIKDPGFKNKHKWFVKRSEEGLKLKILKDDKKKIGFIEYVPAEKAWRPIDAEGYMFIQCMYVYATKDKNKGYGGQLIESCWEDVKKNNMKGVCTMTSKGSWISDRRLFEKNGFVEVDQRGRFELLMKNVNDKTSTPKLLDWESRQKEYSGWHLLYADQCPWHEKSVLTIQEIAKESGISIKTTKLESAEEAQNSPSGFGVFALLKDGQLIEDHYISATRFKNILGKFKV